MKVIRNLLRLDATDLIGVLAAGSAVLTTALGYFLVVTKAEWSPCSRALVAYGIGFWTAMFLHLVAEAIKSPRAVLGRLLNSFGQSSADRLLAALFMAPGLGLGIWAVSAPITAEAPLPVAVGVALLLASFLYSEFTLPSYKRT
ncbi:hypothetical protein ACO0J1_14860 [Stenotrophomonas acidaminiphila]|uniref:hypothetical protein n=1 Tax=Stenotrophomonas acidaminiphila TaxID=128780 RepID=UPI003BF1127F